MFEYFVYTYGYEIIGLILCAIAGCIGFGLKKIYAEYINDKTKETIAKASAAFVEQVWKSIHGAEKLQKALETAQTLLAKKGIDFDADEMEVLIEAAVAEFNETFQKPVDAENTAGAVRRVPETVAE